MSNYIDTFSVGPSQYKVCPISIDSNIYTSSIHNNFSDYSSSHIIWELVNNVSVSRIVQPLSYSYSNNTFIGSSVGIYYAPVTSSYNSSIYVHDNVIIGNIRVGTDEFNNTYTSINAHNNIIIGLGIIGGGFEHAVTDVQDNTIISTGRANSGAMSNVFINGGTANGCRDKLFIGGSYNSSLTSLGDTFIFGTDAISNFFWSGSIVLPGGSQATPLMLCNLSKSYIFNARITTALRSNPSSVAVGSYMFGCLKGLSYSHRSNATPYMNHYQLYGGTTNRNVRVGEIICSRVAGRRSWYGSPAIQPDLYWYGSNANPYSSRTIDGVKHEWYYHNSGLAIHAPSECVVYLDMNCLMLDAEPDAYYPDDN